jgi:glycosyltransferase involved in cell wall biosynthesis
MYRARVHALLGVEVADTDEIAKEWIDIANEYADALIVNSKWSYDAFTRSGAKVPVYVVYHAYNPALEQEVDFSKVDKEIQLIKKLKDEKKFKLMFISLWHSDYRKGADLFYTIASRIQKERNDVYFLVKSAVPRSDFRDLRMFNVTGIVPFQDMVAMYKLADVYLLPSRGGSFELNCLEALVAGVPCVSTEGGAWEEFYDEHTRHLLVKSRDRPVVLPGNRIHVGRGVEMDVDSAVEKVLAVLDNLSEEKAKVRASLDYLREKFSYDAVREQIINVVENI